MKMKEGNRREWFIRGVTPTGITLLRQFRSGRRCVRSDRLYLGDGRSQAEVITKLMLLGATVDAYGDVWVPDRLDTSKSRYEHDLELALYRAYSPPRHGPSHILLTGAALLDWMHMFLEHNLYEVHTPVFKDQSGRDIWEKLYGVSPRLINPY